jgi:hypothetical protein
VALGGGGRATSVAVALGAPIATASDSVVLQTLGWKMSVMCRGCRATSVSPDPVAVLKNPAVGISLDTVRRWPYAEGETGAPRGQMCWYCSRVYITLFKPRAMDWNSLSLLLNLLTGFEFCVFFHQLDQALLSYVDGRQRHEYTYDCPLPNSPEIPTRIETMSPKTELLTSEYIRCFCVGAAAQMARAGHELVVKKGRVVFAVPTGQLLLMRAQQVPAPAAALQDAEAGGEDASGAEHGDDISDDGQEEDHPRKRSRQSFKTSNKVVGYAKQTLGKVDKMLASASSMLWHRDSVERMLTRLNHKMKTMNQYRGELDRLQLRGGDQSILIRMTAATRQLKVFQEVLLAMRGYFNDASDRARPKLLDSLKVIETNYASALETLKLSTEILLEAGARGMKRKRGRALLLISNNRWATQTDTQIAPCANLWSNPAVALLWRVSVMCTCRHVVGPRVGR